LGAHAYLPLTRTANGLAVQESEDKLRRMSFAVLDMAISGTAARNLVAYVTGLSERMAQPSGRIGDSLSICTAPDRGCLPLATANGGSTWQVGSPTCLSRRLWWMCTFFIAKLTSF